MTLYEFTGISVCRAEEKQVYLVERSFAGEYEIGFTEQAGMYVGNFVSGVTFTVNENDFYIGVVDQ